MFSVFQDRAKNAAVTVSIDLDEGDTMVDIQTCGYWEGNLDPEWTEIECEPPLSGTFVRVQFMAETSMSFYEVEVIGW